MTPVTSISLLRVLGEDSQSPRWTEFARLYASTIDGFLFKYFPQVDAEEVVNETLVALVEKLPLYEYDPDTKGHFRNYLIGIVRFKAIEQLKRYKRDYGLKTALETESLLSWEYDSANTALSLLACSGTVSNGNTVTFSNPENADFSFTVYRIVGYR